MKINFFGDASLYNIDYNTFQFCDNLNKLLDESDFNVCNLECPITTRNKKDNSLAVTMLAPKNSLSLLKKFHLFSLANNHIRDFYDIGIDDTKENLKQMGVAFFGIARTQKEALSPYLFEKEGSKFAFIGATRFANTDGTCLGTGNDNCSLIIRQIKELKQQGYFVSLFPHWGYEYVRIPSPRERRLAHRWIDAGADLVIGSHPHIYQTIEKYKDKTIVYSLGNFVFHSSVFSGLSQIESDPRLNEALAVSINVDRDLSYSTHIHGFNTTDDSVILHNSKKNEQLKNEITRISAIHYKSYWEYSKQYYQQSIEISEQNKKVRTKFQDYNRMSFIDKIKVYKNANLQDVKNRLAGMVLSRLR